LLGHGGIRNERGKSWIVWWIEVFLSVPRVSELSCVSQEKLKIASFTFGHSTPLYEHGEIGDVAIPFTILPLNTHPAYVSLIASKA
jgi:hypothetical protein